MTHKTDRRCFLARGVMGAAAVGAAHASLEEKTLLAACEQGAPITRSSTTSASESMPCGKIRDVSVSRLFIGGNLIGGWAHSRDLMYASKLFTAYNTESKVFETLELAQDLGINTIQIDPKCWDVVLKYNQRVSNGIQTMVCVSLLEDKTEMNDEIKRRIDLGATLVYSHGGETDSFMMRGGSMDVIAQMIDLIKTQGVPAGVGGHSLNMPKACEKHKIDTDFYVKTFHMDRYWSATPAEHRTEYDWMRGNASDHNANNDNMWCNNPEETAAFMATVNKPWVAFKVMAAGAIHPRVAFSYAYRKGADFIVAGMFDFHVEQDVELALSAIHHAEHRDRPWCA